MFWIIFYVRDVDFVGPFSPSFYFTYIFMLVDYVFKWTDALATATDNDKTVVAHVKSLTLHRYEGPKVIVSDRGTYFYNKKLRYLASQISCIL